MKSEHEPTPKLPNRIPGMSIYLGAEPERTRRLEALKRMAAQLHVSASEMFRMLADGELSVIITPPGMTVAWNKQQSVGKSKSAKVKPELTELMGDETFQANMATAFASEQVLAREWLTPEEDEAWRDL